MGISGNLWIVVKDVHKLRERDTNIFLSPLSDKIGGEGFILPILCKEHHLIPISVRKLGSLK